MNDIYDAPASNLKITAEEETIIRPRVVTIIASIFLLLAIIDFVLSVKQGIFYKTYTLDDNGNSISNGYKAEILWLILYGIGAGLMRGGKFARFMACLFGTLALVIPGAVMIYYLYMSEAKKYFSNKLCDRCGDTRYLNNSFTFKSIKCRNCSRTLKFKSA